MGKKPIVSLTYENERISIKKKNSLPYLKCVLRLSCVVHGPDLWPFYGLLCKPVITVFSLYREKTVYIKTHKTAITANFADEELSTHVLIRFKHSLY